MGAAGDMLMSALYEICPLSVKEEFLLVMNDLFPNVTVAVETVCKNGIQGTQIHVLVDGEEEESHDCHLVHDHEHLHGQTHAHEHNHGHGHAHAHDHAGDIHAHHSLMDIYNAIEAFNIPEAVKKKACETYSRIAAAEGHAHGREMTEIHFHEVGTRDAVADVVGCCWLIDKLAPERMIVSPVRTGYGHVRCAHGILSVPAPATACLLQGVPCYAGDIEGELCTPTGAAVLGVFADEFGTMPVMTVEKIGYGMGRKEYPVLNCVRSFIGTTADNRNMEPGNGTVMTGNSADIMTPNGTIVELACNIDDMTAEEMGYVFHILRENKALEVYTTAVQMKKNRSGHVLTCLCEPQQEAVLAELLMRHTTTIGIRRKEWDRYELERRTEVLDTKYGPVRVKISEGYGIEKRKLEYDDLARIAGEQGCSIAAIRNEIAL